MKDNTDVGDKSLFLECLEKGVIWSAIHVCRAGTANWMPGWIGGTQGYPGTSTMCPVANRNLWGTRKKVGNLKHSLLVFDFYIVYELML